MNKLIAFAWTGVTLFAVLCYAMVATARADISFNQQIAGSFLLIVFILEIAANVFMHELTGGLE